MQRRTRNICAVFLSAALFISTEYFVVKSELLNRLQNTRAEMQTEDNTVQENNFAEKTEKKYSRRRCARSHSSRCYRARYR